MIIGVGTLAFLLTSCFKTSNCECTKTIIETGDVYTSNEPVTSVTGGKKQRKAFCKANESSDSYQITVCKLTK